MVHKLTHAQPRCGSGVGSGQEEAANVDGERSVFIGADT